MTPDEQRAFLTVHRDLPRQGPGCFEDVKWAVDLAKTKGAVRVLDAACGPGSDLDALARLLPEARIEGIEMIEHFVDEARNVIPSGKSDVTVRLGNMMDVEGPIDLIWCAGAIYFVGVTSGLQKWKSVLAPDGAVAFSEPVLLTPTPSKEALAFWEEYPQITDIEGIEAQVSAAGFRTLGHRLIVGEPWANYYEPMQIRLNQLSAEDTEQDLAKAITLAQTEIDRWRAARDEIAYALLVVKPQ